MDADQYNNYLGQFISHYARMLDAERYANKKGRRLENDVAWLSAQSQRTILHEAHTLLINNPVIGKHESNYVSRDRNDLNSGIEISIDRIRAMAHDAALLANIASAQTEIPDWWYDPKAPRGVTTFFPGNSNNTYSV